MSFPEDILEKKQVEDLLNEGGSEFLGEMLKLYEEYIPPLITELNEACKKEDRPQIKELAHSVKGSSGNIGAKLVQEASGVLEVGFASLSAAELVTQGEKVAEEFTISLKTLKALL
jgi:HPt (histidine-containing phosphotransfer) domain-containing protein